MESIDGNIFELAKNDPIAPKARRLIEKMNLEYAKEFNQLCAMTTPH